MLTTLTRKLENPTIRIGLILLFVSAILHLFASSMDTLLAFDFLTPFFFVQYFFTIVYLIAVMRNNKRVNDRFFKFSNFAHNIILLQLFNLSAYALNKSIPVFDVSTNGLTIFLMLANFLLLLNALIGISRNKWLDHLTVSICSVALLFHLYESIFVMQLYVVAVLSFWFFGIVLHAFVPLLLFIANAKVIKRYFKKSSVYWPTSSFSIFVVICFAIYVSNEFCKVSTKLEETYSIHKNTPYSDQSLPPWVKLGQSIENNWLNERILKSGITYSGANKFFNFGGGNFTPFKEPRKHDPFILFASFWANDHYANRSRKIKLLTSMYDLRHQSERLLWRGDDLTTSDIVTNVQLFPAYRLAYTEKIFSIKNLTRQRWRNSQEAFYTFHLPEGSVVTSASLWIEGNEEPAYLTTTAKADSAYRTIVGRERRDPLLLHWQEGNRVTVRVFPCTPDEDRQFKIGVTTPLQYKEDKLIYTNVDFQGPYFSDAIESINIVTEGPLYELSTPFSFDEDGTTYKYSGAYLSDWSLEFNAPPLSKEPFSFNDQQYQLSEHIPKTIDFDAKSIYLDVNKSWSKREYNKILSLAKDKDVFVYSNDRMEKVGDWNQKALFRQLRKQNFTLFPFHKIQNPEQALVISKYSQVTPTLKDLEGYQFNQLSSDFFKANNNAVNLYNIGQEISPYLRSLSELRSIHLISGDKEQLYDHLKENSFIAPIENEQLVVNKYAGIQIAQSSGDTQKASQVPDHLMRLFVYNRILDKVGEDYFHKKELENSLIELAESAYVVSPISSMIVLESQADYDRFDIKKSKNSLQNASIGNAGAVPEPHEWVLLLIVLGSLLFFWTKTR